MRCSSHFARRVPAHGVNVLLIGESGAGKSLLVKVRHFLAVTV
jgi:transcriptional regulator with PAS, ATPase and Fis domain